MLTIQLEESCMFRHAKVTGTNCVYLCLMRRVPETSQDGKTPVLKRVSVKLSKHEAMEIGLEMIRKAMEEEDA